LFKEKSKEIYSVVKEFETILDELIWGGGEGGVKGGI